MDFASFFIFYRVLLTFAVLSLIFGCVIAKEEEIVGMGLVVALALGAVVAAGLWLSPAEASFTAVIKENAELKKACIRAGIATTTPVIADTDFRLLNSGEE